MYVTIVVPTGKSLFGACVLRTVGVLPELSVAVGSVQTTKAELTPAEAVIRMSSGHPLTNGGIVSIGVAKMQNKAKLQMHRYITAGSILQG